MATHQKIIMTYFRDIKNEIVPGEDKCMKIKEEHNEIPNKTKIK